MSDGNFRKSVRWVAMVSPIRAPEASNRGMLPLASELTVKRASGSAALQRPAGSPSSTLTSSSLSSSGSRPAVRSANPPARTYSMASSRRRRLRLAWVGTTWHGGISVSFIRRQQVFEAPRSVAEMDVQDARFSAEHPADAALGGQLGDVLEGRLAGAVVGQGDFAGPDDFVDEDEVGADASGDRLHRKLVGAREQPGRDALDLQGPGFGQERGHVAGDAVRAQAADDRGHAARGDVLDGDFGRPGGRTAFSAAAQDMDVRIDESGQDRFSLGLDHVDVQAARFDGPRRGDRLDAAAGDEDVADAQRTRREDGSPTDEKGHGTPPDRESDLKVAQPFGDLQGGAFRIE